MKRLLNLLWIPLLLSTVSPALAAAGIADATFTCISPKFYGGQDQWGIYTMFLTTTDPYGTPNGELAPDYTGAYSHFCQFVIDDGTGFPMIGTLGLDAPLVPDENDNGFSDFFEVAQSISGTTSGSYSVPGVINNAGVTATWSRGADSTRGTCMLTLASLNTFSMPFDIIEFKGPLPYTPGSPRVKVSMELPQTGNPENRMGGALEFLKDTVYPFDLLYLQAETMTNSAGETLAFYETAMDRDLDWPTNYYGYVEFDNDGDYMTFYPYALYQLSIDDLNDADNDKIPDFSDNATVTPPRQPSLSLSFNDGTLSLTIRGDVGRAHRIERAQTWPPTPAGWSAVQTVTLTTDPQAVTLPVPQNSPAFWRVVAQ